MGNRASAHSCLRQGFKGRAIEQRHGDIPIRIFRLIYGGGFAPAFSASHSLHHTMAIMDRPSLDKLLTDHESGQLEAKIAQALEQDASNTNLSITGMVLGVSG